MRVVVGHANPDFDAYAATVAATKVFPGARGVFLGTQNENVREFHNLHEGLFDFVDLKALDVRGVDTLIMVDTRDPGRIGELGRVAARKDVHVVVYDHHPPAEADLSGPRVEDRSMEVGATVSILVHEIRRRGIELTPMEASLMLLGIHEDTGSLTYPGTTAYDADAAAYLLAAGADLDVLNRFLSRTLTAAQRRLFDALLATLETWDVNGQTVAVGTASTEEYVDSASVVTHYLVEDLGYRVAFGVIEMPDRVHVVGRSRLGEVDVAAVLRHLGGGGHTQAASARLRDVHSLAALERLRDALQAEVRPPLRAVDIASRPVRTATEGTLMRDAGALMERWGHGSLPVVEDGRVIGIVTRKDVDKATRHGLEHAPVKGFMGRDVICVGPDADLPSLERLLATESIGRVPVVEEGELTGIVTRKDLLRAEHGREYLDLERAADSAEARRFLEGMERVLPPEAREALHRVGSAADAAGVRAHAVGGFVRDMLLGRANLDIDVVVEGDGVAFAEEVSRETGWRVKAHRRFGTAVLVLSRGLHIDIASSRTEYYTRPGALPTVERSSLRQDLFRRDFTVNAMAACVNPECFGAIADPFGGLRDLERGRVRVLHTMSFVEDPTRVLRAARFEERFGFAMEDGTEDLARQCVDMGLLEEVSGARLREELLDILDEALPGQVLGRLQDLGALSVLLPETRDGASAAEAVTATAEEFPEVAEMLPAPPSRRGSLLVPLAAGVQAGHVERWVRVTRLSRDAAQPLAAFAERGEGVARLLRARRAPRRSMLYEALCSLPPETLPYLWATGDDRARDRIRLYAEELVRVRPAVDGRDLVEMGYAPSAGFADVLRRALADRLDGVASGREAELENLRRLADEAGVARTTRGEP